MLPFHSTILVGLAPFPETAAVAEPYQSAPSGPVRVNAATSSNGLIVALVAFQTLLIAAAVGVGLYLYAHHAGTPTPVTADFARLGAEVASVMGTAAADGFLAAADAIHAGKGMGDAEAAADAANKASRAAEFAGKVVPALSTLAPAGQDPSPSQRAALEAAFRNLAAGIKGAHR